MLHPLRVAAEVHVTLGNVRDQVHERLDVVEVLAGTGSQLSAVRIRGPGTVTTRAPRSAASAASSSRNSTSAAEWTR